MDILHANSASEFSHSLGQMRKSSPNNGHFLNIAMSSFPQKRTLSPRLAMCEKCGFCCKSLFGAVNENSDAFHARRREGLYRFIQNRSRTSGVALKATQRQRSPRDFRAARFSTFATKSVGTRQRLPRKGTIGHDHAGRVLLVPKAAREHGQIAFTTVHEQTD